MGVLILSQGIFVKIGLITGILWVLFVAQFLPINDVVLHIILGFIQTVLLLGTYDVLALELFKDIMK